MKIHTSITGALTTKKLFVAGALGLSLIAGGVATTNIIHNTFALEGDDTQPYVISTDNPVDTPITEPVEEPTEEPVNDPSSGTKGGSDVEVQPKTYYSLQDNLPSQINLLAGMNINLFGDSLDIPFGDIMDVGEHNDVIPSYLVDEYLSVEIEDESIVKFDDDHYSYDSQYRYEELTALKAGRTKIHVYNSQTNESFTIKVNVGKLTTSPIVLARTGVKKDFTIGVSGFDGKNVSIQPLGVMNVYESSKANAYVRNNGNNSFSLVTPAVTDDIFESLYIAPMAITVDGEAVGSVLAVALPIDAIKAIDNISHNPENETKFRGVLEVITSTVEDYLNKFASSSNIEQDLIDSLLDIVYEVKIKPIFENGELVGIQDFDIKLKDGTIVHFTPTEIINQIKGLVDGGNSFKKERRLSNNVRLNVAPSAYYDEGPSEAQQISELIKGIGFELNAYNSEVVDTNLAAVLPKGTKGIQTKSVVADFGVNLQGVQMQLAYVTRMGEPVEVVLDASNAEPGIPGVNRRWFVAYYDGDKKEILEATYDANTKTIRFMANAMTAYTYGYIDGYNGVPLVPDTGAPIDRITKTAAITFAPLIALTVAAFIARNKKKQDKKLAKNLKTWN